MPFYSADRNQIANADYQRQPYFDGQQVNHAFNAGNAIIFGWLGIKAGRNFWHRFQGQGASMVDAAAQGVYAAMRWKIWAFTVCVWVFWTGYWAMLSTNITDRFINFDPTMSDPTIVAPGTPPADPVANWFRTTVMLRPYDLTTPRLLFWMSLVLGLFCVGVTYNLCIRESLFQRRWLYKLLAPVERAVRWVPWPILHSLVMVTPVLPIILYNQMHVPFDPYQM